MIHVDALKLCVNFMSDLCCYFFSGFFFLFIFFVFAVHSFEVQRTEAQNKLQFLSILSKWFKSTKKAQEKKNYYKNRFFFVSFCSNSYFVFFFLQIIFMRVFNVWPQFYLTSRKRKARAHSPEFSSAELRWRNVIFRFGEIVIFCFYCF